MNTVLSVDIGGTNVKYGLVKENGILIEKGIFSSKNGNGLHVLAEIDKLVQAKYQDAISGIAISTPGFIDAKDGLVIRGGAIKEFANTPLKEKLTQRYKLPVTVENDANCAAHAEKWLGFAKDIDTFICITVGTGIGGAIYIENRLLRGKNFRAGEFGSMFIDGHRNWNSLSSLKSLRQKYARHHSMSDINFSTEEIFSKKETGEFYSSLIISDFYKYLAYGVYNLFTIFDPELILIGGGLSQRDEFINELSNHLKVFNQYNENINIRSCRFKNDAGIIGAAYFHFKSLL